MIGRPSGKPSGKPSDKPSGRHMPSTTKLQPPTKEELEERLKSLPFSFRETRQALIEEINRQQKWR